MGKPRGSMPDIASKTFDNINLKNKGSRGSQKMIEQITYQGENSIFHPERVMINNHRRKRVPKIKSRGYKISNTDTNINSPTIKSNDPTRPDSDYAMKTPKSQKILTPCRPVKPAQTLYTYSELSNTPQFRQTEESRRGLPQSPLHSSGKQAVQPKLISDLNEVSFGKGRGLWKIGLKEGKIKKKGSL